MNASRPQTSLVTRSRTRWTCPSLIVLLAAATLVATGCSGDPDVPDATTVKDIRQRTLRRIDELQTAIDSNTVTADQVRNLVVSLNFLVGHMRTLHVGTEEEIEAVDEARYQLSEHSRRGMALPPQHWRPDEDNSPLPDPIIQPGPIRDLLPQIRAAVEAVPESDASPDDL